MEKRQKHYDGFLTKKEAFRLLREEGDAGADSRVLCLRGDGQKGR